MKSLFGLLFVLMGFIWRCDGYNTIYVGGKHGWILKTEEDYNQWSQKSRFQVNDTLVFKYGKGHNSVLEVTEENYNNCNKSLPIQSLEYHNGHSEFKLNKSGPFYFISGYNHDCHMGQKVKIVVLALRHHSHYTPAPAPAPVISPEYHAPAPAPAPHASKAAVGVSISLFLGLSLVLGTFAVLF